MISIISSVITLLLVWVGWRQLCMLNKRTQGEFSYKLYKDLLAFLEKPSNSELREWIYKLDRPITKQEYKRWKMDDYLGYFEAIGTLKEKGLIDEEICYDLLSDYLIELWEHNNFGLRKIIENLREEENKPDLYEKTEKLYNEMKKYEEKKKKVWKRKHKKEKDLKENKKFPLSREF